MTFISLIIALGVVQIVGSGAPLHKDRWYFELVARLKQYSTLTQVEGSVLFLSLVLPLLALAVILTVVGMILPSGWDILVYIPVLLYSLGRGDFTQQVNAYLDAWRRQDSALAANIISDLEGSDRNLIAVDDWSQMHRQALRAIAYRGFERMFAVVFWFLCLGAGGALVYRLSALFRQSENLAPDEAALAARWQWLLEWPAVRLLGFSWALVGNFAGCIQQWTQCLFCAKRPSEEVLQYYLIGALGANSSVAAEVPDRQSAAASKSNVADSELALEVEALQALLSRSLLMWLSVVAILMLVA